MSKILLMYAFFCILYAAMVYSTDKPTFKNGVVESLTKPSVFDLPSNSTLHVINDYVNYVVFPARSYFDFDFGNYDSDSSGKSLLHLFYLLLPPIFICKHLKTTYSSLGLVFAIVVCLVVCIVTMIIIFKLYNRFFKLETFDLSAQDLRDQFARYTEPYPISEYKSFNNYVIDRYLNYYYSVSKKAYRRKIFGKVFDGTLTVIYILFFYRSYYN